jgi:hypothetical protein
MWNEIDRPECQTESVPRFSTLLALVQSLQDETDSEDDVVETAANFVNSGRVVLTGNFAGCRLDFAS